MYEPPSHRFFEYKKLDLPDTEWETFVNSATDYMSSPLNQKVYFMKKVAFIQVNSAKKRVEQLESVCQVERDIVVKRSIAVTQNIRGDLDLIETIIKCDFDRMKSPITNGEPLYRVDASKVLFAPRI